MAAVIRRFSATIPAGTAKAAPVLIKTTMPPYTIERVEVIVPPGPRGQAGFKLTVSGAQAIPYGNDDFFVADSEKIEWDLQGFPDSGDWGLLGYNLGTQNHTLEIRYFCQLIDTSPPAEQFTPLPVDALQSA